MNNISAGTDSTPIEQGKGQMIIEGSHSSQGEVIVKSVVTALWRYHQSYTPARVS
jgi:hypothetical protein